MPVTFLRSDFQTIRIFAFLVSSDQEPAINDDRLAGDVARTGRGQKNNDVGNILGLAEPTHGDEGSSGLCALGAERMLLRQKLRCADVAGCYAIHAHPAAREFDSEAADQPD